MSLLPVSHLSLQATWELWGLAVLGRHKRRGVEIIQNTPSSSHLSFPFEKKLLQSSRDKTEIRETEAAPETLLSKHSSSQGREETEETRKTPARLLYWFNATSKPRPASPPVFPGLEIVFLFVCWQLCWWKNGIKYDKGFPCSSPPASVVLLLKFPTKCCRWISGDETVIQL